MAAPAQGGSDPLLAAGQGLAAGAAPTLSPAPALTGRLRDRYQLQGMLRSVDGTQIWLAVDEKLNRSVAVYLMSSGGSQVPGVLAAARGAATVPDTRFLQVLDAVDDGTTAYVVTEWLADAVELGRTLALGPITPWEAIRLAADLTEAMASAHALGQTHLRLDPATVLRTGSEQVKIQGLRLEAALAGLDQTPQAEAEAADVRAVGALLYAALTARWPFGGGFGLPPAPLDGGVPRGPAALAPGIPAELDELTMRLLMPPETDRPALSCAEAAGELARLPRPVPPRRTSLIPSLQPGPTGLAFETGDPTPASGTRNGRAALPLAAVTLVVAGLGVLGARFFGITGQPPAAHQTTKAQTSTSATTPRSFRLPISDATLWNADPTKDEHSAEVRNTISGKGLAWTTSSYTDGPKMLIKPGTGIIYDLGSVQTVSSATVHIGAAGATVQMLAADPALTALPPVQASAPPGFTVLTSVDATSTTVRLATTQPVRTRYVLIWFTALPNQGVAQYHPHPYYDSISLVQIFGPAQ